MEAENSAQVLEFIVNFAQEDLTGFREGDWLNLRADFAEVFRQDPKGGLRSATGITVINSKEPFLSKFSQDDWKALQANVRAVIDEMVERQAEMDRENGISGKPPGWNIPLIFYFVPTPSAEPGAAPLVLGGTVRDTVIAVLFFLLSQEENRRLKRCPECGKMFVGTRKQQYDIPTCANRAYMREWRSRPEGQALNRKRARASYHKRKIKKEA